MRPLLSPARGLILRGMKSPASDIAFTATVKRLQSERGSRAAYARLEQQGGFATTVDDELRAFLATIDTAFLASASADGQPYVQHRGGPKGFIRALDDATLGFVDFAGNRQYVTTGNLLENDRVCLFLIDYARRRRVKVWGTARVVPASDELLAQLMPEGHRARPEQVVLVTVRAWDVNCPQHIPQKLDAADVAATVERLEARIAELERDQRAPGGRTG
jgi:predicted pyridoxine 5'-phosphate oxidase superfamily flavin-nucleotide-binding protein